MNVSAFQLILYLLNFQVKTVPLSQHKNETEPEVYARYISYAENAVQVALDPEESPLFAGEYGRIKTAILIMSIRRLESFHRLGPIHGDCYEHQDKQCRKPTDKPHSFCHMQIQPGPTGIVLDKKYWHYASKDEVGITGQDLDNDDVLCDRVGLHMMRQSLDARKDLSLYTGEMTGGKFAKNRMNYAQSWYAKYPVDNVYPLLSFMDF